MKYVHTKIVLGHQNLIGQVPFTLSSGSATFIIIMIIILLYLLSVSVWMVVLTFMKTEKELFC